MTITITFGEIMDRGLWDEFCGLCGINPWAMNEGLATKDETYQLSEEQAVELGLIEERGE